MPAYSYKCKACSSEWDEIRKVGEMDKPVRCVVCEFENDGKKARVECPGSAFKLNGSGWAEDGYSSVKK